MLFFKINNLSQSVQSTDNQSDIKNLSVSTFISPFYALFFGGKENCLHAK